MYARQFQKWAWHKYGTPRAQGARAYIRSKQERLQLGSNFAPIFARLVDDELTRHLGRISLEMPSFVLVLSRNDDRKGFSIQITIGRLMSKVLDFFLGVFEFIRESPVKGRYYLEGFFERVTRELVTSNLDSVFIFCITIPLSYLLQDKHVAVVQQIITVYLDFILGLSRVRFSDHLAWSTAAGLKMVLATGPEDSGQFTNILRNIMDQVKCQVNSHRPWYTGSSNEDGASLDEAILSLVTLHVRRVLSADLRKAVKSSLRSGK